mmetsp:Transcript_720/g.999  ORF Transcript_720/g.999 Transcript_720/m.999 type:complete len:92 (-) Transcript_720:631-906(-)
MQEDKVLCVTVKQSNTTKNRLHNAIKEKNFDKVVDIMNKYDIDSNEEISVKGHYWTCIHYACHFNVESILDFLIKRAYDRNFDEFTSIMNT